MKTIRTANGSYMRVTDKEAKRMVDNYDYYHCSKEEWKIKINAIPRETKGRNHGTMAKKSTEAKITD